MHDDYTRRYGRGEYQRYPGGGHPGGYGDEPAYGQRSRTRVDVRTLWGGGAATVLVAVLTSFVGVLIARGIFGLEILAPEEAGVAGDASTGGLAALAAVAALVATALLHLLLLSTPSPQSFFAVIVGLFTVLVALQPFLTDEDLSDKIASMLIYAATGAVIGILLSGVGSYAARRVVYTQRPPGPYGQYPDQTRGYRY